MSPLRDELISYRMILPARRGDLSRCLKKAEAFDDLKDLSGGMCYNLACVYALAAAADVAQADEHARRAMK
jgi:hypothetical protein